MLDVPSLTIDLCSASSDILLHLGQSPLSLPSAPHCRKLLSKPNGAMSDGRGALGRGLGAELRGVTLADVASDDATYASVRTAFEEHSVLVLRNQDVTDDI